MLLMQYATINGTKVSELTETQIEDFKSQDGYKELVSYLAKTKNIYNK